MENLLIIKTTADRQDQLMERVQSLHPYEVPELITCPIDGGLQSYLDWVIDGTRPIDDP